MIKDYRFQTEMHAHTKPASLCSDMTPHDVIDRYASLGFDSVVISNHFVAYYPLYPDREAFLKQYLDGYRETAAYGKEKGIAVVLGCEVRFCNEPCGNDYLLFGITEDDIPRIYDYLGGTFEEFSRAFRTPDKLILQAHPFRDGMERKDPSLLDGIEVFNMHPGHNSRIAVAARYAAEHDFLVSGGTDFHHEGHQGCCALLTKEKITSSVQLAAVLKSRDYLFRIGSSVIFPYGKEPEEL